MTKLSVVIIEDEVPAARLLHTMVARLRPQWEILVLSGNVEESVEWFAENEHPDLIFLDIQLSDGISFDFLSQSKPSSTIIFTTAYDEYAIRAFSVNSIDYILKPIDEKRLLKAIEKHEAVMEKSIAKSTEYFSTILSSLQCKEVQYRSRFLISAVGRQWMLQVSDIAYFYSESKITYAVTKKGTEHMIELSLTKLTEQLNPNQFFRINRQILVFIDAITHIEPYFNGKIAVLIKPPYKHKVTISEDKIKPFKTWLNF